MASELELAARARRAYELGRLRASVPALLFVLPLVFLALCVCDQPMATAACGAALALAAVGFLWRGQGYGRGVFQGVPPTGREVRIPLCVCYDFRDGKLAEGRVYFEFPAFLEQVQPNAAARDQSGDIRPP